MPVPSAFVPVKVTVTGPVVPFSPSLLEVHTSILVMLKEVPVFVIEKLPTLPVEPPLPTLVSRAEEMPAPVPTLFPLETNKAPVLEKLKPDCEKVNAFTVSSSKVSATSSSSKIVPTPCASKITPPVGLLRFIKKVSLPSMETSPLMVALTVCVKAPPAVKLRVVNG